MTVNELLNHLMVLLQQQKITGQTKVVVNTSSLGYMPVEQVARDDEYVVLEF